MTTTEAPGIKIREAALEALDESRALEAERLIPNADIAFKGFFGEAIPGVYRPRDTMFSSAVVFDLEDGLSIWSMLENRPGSKGKMNLRKFREWTLVGPCSTKRCEIPRLIALIKSRTDLGRVIESLDEGLCHICRRKAES